MKIAYLLTLFLCSYAHAELPTGVTDPKTLQVLEYLDAKINKAQQSVNTLSGSTQSTSTVVAIGNGGTSATTAAGARANLGVPSNTGSGASGTWPINITGSAATATDSSKVAKTGDTMTGSLVMSGSSITFVNPGAISGVKSIQTSSISSSEYWGDISSTTGRNIDTKTLHNYQKDPTGFPYSSLSLSSLSLSGRVFTINGSNFPVYINGARVVMSTSQATIPNTTQTSWLYYATDVSTYPSVSASFPGFDKCLIASVYYSTRMVSGLLGDERHGSEISWKDHEYKHDTIGARYASGMSGSFSAGVSTITSGEFYDEDLEHMVPQMSSFTVLYKNGSSFFDFAVSTTANYQQLGQLYYNNVNALAALPVGSYAAYWVLATPFINYPYVVVVGNRSDTTLAAARENNTLASLSLTGFPTPELKPISRVIYRQGSGSYTYQENADYRSVSELPGANYVPTQHSSLSGLSLTEAAHPYDQAGGFASYDWTSSSLAAKPDYDEVIPSTATGIYPLSISGNAARVSAGGIDFSTITTHILTMIPSTATGHYGISVASANYAPGDDLGNHTAEENLDMATYNIDGVDRIAIGTIRDYYTGFTEYGRKATFEADILGNSAIQKGSQLFNENRVIISSTAASLPNRVDISVDCVTAGCGYSDTGSGLISDNGTYFRFYGGNGDSIIIQTVYYNNDVPVNSTIIGAQGFIEKYSNSPTNIVTGVYEGTDASYCKLTSVAPNEVYGKNQCATNDWAVTSSTYVYGNSSYSWDYQISTTEANGTSFGWVQSIKLTGNATAYIDVMKMQLFYIDNDTFKIGHNINKLSIDYNATPIVYVSTYNSVGIMDTPDPTYALDVTGGVNSTAGFFKNGVEVGGTSSGVSVYPATATIQANYGISATTIAVSGNSFSVGGSTLVVANGVVTIGTTTQLPPTATAFQVSFSTVVPSSNKFTMFLDDNSPLGADVGAGMAFRGAYKTAGTLATLAAIKAGKTSATDSELKSYLSLYTRDTSVTERVRIAADGKVGINTTTPGSTLHVNGDTTISGAVTAQSTMTISGSSFSVGGSTLVVANGRVGVGTNNPQRPLEIYNLLENSAQLSLGYSSSYRYDIGRSTAQNSTTDGLLLFYGNQSNYDGYVFGGISGEKVRILPSGKVGIKTTTPGSTLHVNGDITGGSITATSSITATGAGQFGGTVGIFKTDGILTDSALSGISYAYHRIRNSANTAQTLIGIEATTPAGVYNGSLANASFLVTGAATPLQFGTNATANMTILNGGNVGIGTTGPGYKLDVQGGDINTSGAYKINGVAVSGLGNVVLASTQTFSGANTFQSSTTFNGTIYFGSQKVFKYQYFTADGTWVKPSNVSWVNVKCIGGGGGGSGGDGSSPAGGGGGGGGGYIVEIDTPVYGNVAVTISTGAAGGASDSAGGTASPTCFGTICAAGGIGGGVPAGTAGAVGGNGGSGGGGGGGGGASAGAAGGNGGALNNGSNGTSSTYAGGTGGTGYFGTTSVASLFGVTNTTSSGGAGNSTNGGGGGGGNGLAIYGGSGLGGAGGSNSAGANGSGYGAGGGGGAGKPAGGYTGGNGAAGICRVGWFE